MIGRLHRTVINDAMVTCSSCKFRPAAHSIGRRWKQYALCCECYVATGSPPILWHPDCVRAWRHKHAIVVVALCTIGLFLIYGFWTLNWFAH
jgi:hypothetical protein